MVVKNHLPEKDILNAAKNKKAARRWTAYKLPRSGLVQHVLVDLSEMWKLSLFDN